MIILTCNAYYLLIANVLRFVTNKNIVIIILVIPVLYSREKTLTNEKYFS